MSTVMHAEAVAGAYDRWAPIYDVVFGGVFKSGRARAAEAANRIGGRILEAGVGTGISLPLYRSDCRLVGIDISKSMLEKARERVSRLGLRNIENIAVMEQIRNNSPDQAILGDFSNALDDAVMESGEAHQNQMNQVLSDRNVAASFGRIVFDLLVARLGDESARQKPI